MKVVKEEKYKGWTIKLTPEGDMCSTFAMTLEAPTGGTVKHVPLAGDTEKRALERGREMIDMEIELAK